MKPKLEYIEWEDAVAPQSGWKSQEACFRWAKNTVCVVKQTGWTVEDTSSYILTVSQILDWGKETPDYSLIQRIPKSWVRLRKRIKL